jgi:hypothetical protein
MRLGIVVLTNQESGAAFLSVTNAIKDSYLGFKPEDWILRFDTLDAKSKKEDAELTQKIQEEIERALLQAGNRLDVHLFIGEYVDDWLGKVIISERNGKLWFQSARSPQLKGEMSFYKGNTFAVKWVKRSMKADAFVLFNLDQDGNALGFQMKAISPLTDFSYDFHDLDFKRVTD